MISTLLHSTVATKPNFNKFCNECNEHMTSGKTYTYRPSGKVKALGEIYSGTEVCVCVCRRMGRWGKMQPPGSLQYQTVRKGILVPCRENIIPNPLARL